MQTFGARVQEAMHQAGIGQSELARAVGKSRQYVHQVLSGRVLPSSGVADEVCAVLGIEPPSEAERQQRQRGRTSNLADWQAQRAVDSEREMRSFVSAWQGASSAQDVAAQLGITPGAARSRASRLRAAGVDLPYL